MLKKDVAWVLGAADPEMEVIEELLRRAERPVVHAMVGGRRVSPANAYQADIWVQPKGCTSVIFVECDAPLPAGVTVLARADHHRPGDRGFGRPAAEFLTASSVGQVLSLLWETEYFAFWSGSYDPDYDEDRPWLRDLLQPQPKGWCIQARGWCPLPEAVVFAAAADHCLGAAYRGECRGVDPDALMRWRAESRAKFQKRNVSDILADVEETSKALRGAPQVILRDTVVVADMRRDPPFPELPEAAARLGVGYIAGPLVEPDGRRKFTCSGSPEQVNAFIETWAPAQGLAGIYGDPARGFAGGYLTPIRAA